MLNERDRELIEQARIFQKQTETPYRMLQLVERLIAAHQKIVNVSGNHLSAITIAKEALEGSNAK